IGCTMKAFTVLMNYFRPSFSHTDFLMARHFGGRIAFRTFKLAGRQGEKEYRRGFASCGCECPSMFWCSRPRFGPPETPRNLAPVASQSSPDFGVSLRMEFNALWQRRRGSTVDPRL